ncbi:methyl-accepting chemotaxis sensory transducer with Cache sensor [Pseudoxanthobacter soli DSM 19599]|uniref:Methyl-accepting chemotaxis sensory transducer with Cache sensor n=1 Tax=Pseudoxanthobacter soli DSM 19599 TaxID=1123029 RepID=A0A1M7Z823_9HYPH|nr:methyl-accepting chemotaxis protein [Pseudoxanthobacter soli]SHO61051.1 methyl-accepting chemotaxis sensory transducer with Cache sensor [Pseudoxanthobacter soli DSM 19599]
MRIVDWSIRTKLVVFAGALFGLSLAVVCLIGLWAVTNAVRKDAQALGEDIARTYALTVSRNLDTAALAVATGARAVEGVVADGKADRDELGAMVTAMVAANPELVGMTLAFEPNAIEGRDGDFVGHAYSDKTGRFVPYFFHKPDGSVGVEQLVMTPEAGTESWYDKPVRENRSLVTPPYVYPVNGKDVLMSTISMVVRRADKPIGILTGDLGLTNLTAFVGTLKPFGTGRAELVGTDGLWIANGDPKLLGKPVDDPEMKALVQEVQAGQSRTLQATDPTGEAVYRFAIPVDIQGAKERWALILTVPERTVLDTMFEIRDLMAVVALVVLVVVLVAVWIGARLLTRPIVDITEKMRLLAAGDTAIVVEGIDHKDELGAMARAVNVFRENAMQRQALEAESAEVTAARLARQKVVDDLIASFRESAAGLIEAAGRATGDLETVSDRLAAAAAESQQRTRSVRAASTQASGNVQSVATASEELTSSITEISRQISATNTMVTRAATDARATNETITGLATAASRIGDVVRLIEAIASQTNLLALNATIEAARAGEAGKGFAVVASEVKALAVQTSRATDEIITQIASIQTETGTAVDAIRAISRTMEDVNGFMSSIASAVEEQSAATGEIGSNIDSAARGTGAVAADIEELDATVADTSTSANRVLESAGSVRHVATQMEREIEGFLRSVAAA